jgi:hypothetical protein
MLLGDAESVKLGAGVTVRVMAVVLVRLPPVPVIVTVKPPVGAVLEAVRVNVLLEVVLLGRNEAVTPLGNPEADRLTLALNPFCPASVTELVVVAPCARLKVFGEADRVKLPAEITVRAIAVVLVKAPEVPVTVSVDVPIVAELLAVRVRVVVVWVLAGLKEAVTPLGRPEVEKLTVPLKPFHGVTMMVVLAPNP